MQNVRELVARPGYCAAHRQARGRASTRSGHLFTFVYAGLLLQYQGNSLALA
jgi:hypothetical protein